MTSPEEKPTYNEPERPPCPAKLSPQPDYKPVYLRFGDLPPGGRSSLGGLHREYPGWREAGVSVFRGYGTPSGEYLFDLEDNARLQSAFLAFTYEPFLVDGDVFRKSQRPIYTVQGRELPERGTDGEPLLVDVSRCEAIPEDAQVGTTAPIPEEGLPAMTQGILIGGEALMYTWVNFERGLDTIDRLGGTLEQVFSLLGAQPSTRRRRR